MERFAVGLAVAVMVLSASTLAGWWFGVDELLRPFGPFMPIQINAAIAFGTLAAASLARDIGRPRLAIVATIPILLGLISLAENAFNSDLRIDELLEQTGSDSSRIRDGCAISSQSAFYSRAALFSGACSRLPPS